MTASPNIADSPLEGRALYVANIVSAVIGGLSLILSVTAPFNMGMTSWTSFTDVVLTAAVCGGLPLTCAASVVFSRWLFIGGRRAVALVIAGAPLFLLTALLAWALASN